MFLITCPYCGEAREEQEFSYAGEALIKRAPLDSSDAEWGDYLFNRNNTKGPTLEQWQHTLGCRKLFMVERNNVTNDILAIKTFESLRSDS